MKTSSNVAALREQIKATQDRLAGVEDVRVPRTEAVARVDTYIATLQERHAMWTLGSRFGTTATDTVGIESAMGRPMPEVLASVMPDVLRKGLVALVDRSYAGSDDKGLSPTDRTATQAQLRAELFDLEVAEERAIVAAEADGVTVPRRAGASAAAILAA